MASRLDDIPIFESRDTDIDARHFNLVYRALHRLNYQKKEIRFLLPEAVREYIEEHHLYRD